MKPYRILAAICCLAISVITALGATGRKISDYTETLSITDAWIYEIAVPGVTNYKVTFGTMATNIIARNPGVGGGSLVTNANQFGPSITLTLKSGSLLTNLTLPSLTASRPVILNAGGVLTNASGTPDGTKFLRDDGVLAAPVGSGDVTTAQLNISSNALLAVELTNNAAVSNDLVALISASSGGSNRVLMAAGVATNLTTWNGLTNIGNLHTSNVWDRSNVKWWGATGNGTTDDTSAFELAISNSVTSLRTVYVPYGTYLIKRTLVLPSNITLGGDGYVSRITKPTSVKVFLTNGTTVVQGGFSVTLPNTNGFIVGGAIYLEDSTSIEWVSTRAVITNITGTTVTFNKPILGDLQTNRGAYASTSFPLIINQQEGTTNIVIRNLTLDHNRSTNDAREAFVMATIHYEGNFRGLVENCWLLNSPSDAYSDQGTNGSPGGASSNYTRRTSNVIKGSRIHNAARHGVHLGTGTGGSLVQGNHIRECAGYAEFYCAHVIDTVSIGNTVENCSFGFAGIDSRDYANAIIGNSFRNCTNGAVEATSGADGTGGRLTIANNTIDGGPGISLDQPDCTISVNTISSTNGANKCITLNGFADRTTLVGNILKTFGSGSEALTMNSVDDCRLIGNIFISGATMVDIKGCSRMVAIGTHMSFASSFYYNFNGAASTNCVIKDERNVAANPVTETTASLRLVYEGYGNNGNTNPAVAGQWNGITDKMFNGTMVYWTNTTSTNLSVFANGAWVLVTGDASASPSSGGTNYPPVLTTGTNIAVGTGVRKSLLMSTNASVGISFNGTEILGETLTIVVTNTSATASNIAISVFQDGGASSYFDATVASNVTGFLVVSNSSKRMDFVYNGTFWGLESTLAKEMELSVAGGLVLTTNSVTSIVTLSNNVSLQQLNNVGVGTPANGDIIAWNAAIGEWTNSVVPGGDVISNITVSATNNVLLDFGAANIFKLRLLTNWTQTFTNITSLTKKGYVYYQQDTNGGRILNNYYTSGGLLQTNANMQPTTNGSALDLLEVLPGFFTTNLMAYWPQNFQPRVRFTNSLHVFKTFIDSFNRANADPMSTTASDGNTWTTGPGAMGDPRIVSALLVGNTGVTGARVSTPTFGASQSASITIAVDIGAIGPMVRMQGTGDASGYMLVSDDATHLAIYKITDTGTLANTVLFTSGVTPTIVTGNTITLTVNGTTLECFLNGVSYGTTTDATWSAGQPGIWINSATASGAPFTAIEQ